MQGGLTRLFHLLTKLDKKTPGEPRYFNSIAILHRADGCLIINWIKWKKNPANIITGISQVFRAAFNSALCMRKWYVRGNFKTNYSEQFIQSNRKKSFICGNCMWLNLSFFKTCSGRAPWNLIRPGGFYTGRILTNRFILYFPGVSVSSKPLGFTRGSRESNPTILLIY